MSAQITASMVKELREKTGAGMMDVKRALEEAQGDMEKASEILRQKGMATADKKSGRVTAEGCIIAKIADDFKSGVLVEVNCETDFVARGDDFQAMSQELVALVLPSKADTVEQLLTETYKTETVQDFIKEKVGIIKENLSLRRFVRFQRQGAGGVFSYIHMGSKIGVLLELETTQDSVLSNDSFKQLAKDLTMHIASSQPEFVNRDQVPQSVLAHEKEVEMGRADIQNKPAEIREKIVLGRVEKLLADRVLLQQPFVKDPSKTIQDLLNEQSKVLGTDITVKQFVRYLLGEGVEKVQTNFADEVMAQMKV